MAKRMLAVGLRAGLPTVLALVCSAIAWTRLGQPTLGMDDANIFMVYAQNLVGGDGLVYNVGGERVEGYTSTGFLVLMAALRTLLGRPGWFELGVGLLNVALLSAALASLVTGVSRHIRFHTLTIAILVWSFASPAFVTWLGVSLMDSALWSAAWLASAGLAIAELADDRPSLLRRRLAIGLAAALPLIRPEGLLAAWALIALLVLAERRRDVPWSGTLRAVAPTALSWAACTGALTLFRIGYFGHPLPNTFYAKVPPNQLDNLRAGVLYLQDFLEAEPVALLSLLCALGLAAAGLAPTLWTLVRGGGSENRDRIVGFGIAALAAFGIALPTLAGGDHFGGFRFFQPSWPLLALPIALALRHILDATTSLGARAGTAVAAGCVAALAGSVGSAWQSFPEGADLAHEFEIARDGRCRGSVLNQIFPTDPPLVGVITAGGIAYAYDGPILDLVGLNDVEMGHSPGQREGPRGHAAFDRGVFWRRQPEIVTPRYTRAADPMRALRDYADSANDRWTRESVLKGLARDAKFREHYVPAAIANRSDQAWAEIPCPEAPDAGASELLIGFVDVALIERLQREQRDVSVLVLAWQPDPAPAATLAASPR